MDSRADISPEVRAVIPRCLEFSGWVYARSFSGDQDPPARLLVCQAKNRPLGLQVSPHMYQTSAVFDLTICGASTPRPGVIAPV